MIVVEYTRTQAGGRGRRPATDDRGTCLRHAVGARCQCGRVVLDMSSAVARGPLRWGEGHAIYNGREGVEEGDRASVGLLCGELLLDRDTSDDCLTVTNTVVDKSIIGSEVYRSQRR